MGIIPTMTFVVRRPGGGFEIRESHKSGLYVPVLAEAGGESGRRLAAWLERRLSEGPLDWLLWTQYYVAVAGARD